MDLKQEIKNINSKIVEIKENIEKIESTFLLISTQKNLLCDEYKKIVNENKNEEENLDTLGFDSLYFQIKLIDEERKFYTFRYKMIKNKLYGDLYILYKILITYIRNNIFNDDKLDELININLSFPVYKKLKHYIEYDIKVTEKIHSGIIELIEEMIRYVNVRNADIKKNEKQSGLGINLNNLINKKKYDNLIIKSNIEMFVYHITNFNTDINKYLTDVINNIEKMNKRLCDELKLDKTLPNIKTRYLPVN